MPIEVRTSRFAVLPDDDPTDWKEPKQKKKSQPPAAPQTTSKNKKKSKKPDNDQDLRKEAFSTGSKKSKNKQKSSGSNSGSADKNVKPKKKDEQERFEAWQQQDSKFVDVAFEKDIEKAMLLSLVQEEECESVKAQKEIEAKANAKKKAMTLDEFHRMDESAAAGDNGNAAERSMAAASDVRHRIQSESDFFGDVEIAAKKAVNRERIVESIKNMHIEMYKEQELSNKKQDLLKQKDDEISKLKVENLDLSSELNKVKNRYKTMRSILDETELKEKAQIVAEVMKLQRVRDEMAEDVNKLSEELEQSKTKVATLEKLVKQLQEKRHASK